MSSSRGNEPVALSSISEFTHTADVVVVGYGVAGVAGGVAGPGAGARAGVPVRPSGGRGGVGPLGGGGFPGGGARGAPGRRVAGTF